MMYKLVLASISRFTASLSIIGSSAIMYMIISDRKSKLRHPYHRIMLMMSTFDVIQSLTIAVGAAAIPRESDFYGAKGNERSCDAQGFFMMLGYAVPLYNSCLQIFYVLSIRYGISAQQFSKFEPALHAISILFPLSWAVFFTARGYNSPWVFFCIPRGVLPLFVIGATVVLCFLICVISMVCICWKVISQARKMKQYTNFETKNKSSARRRSQCRVNEDKTQTIIQALLYVSAFVLTWTFPSITAFYTKGRVDMSVPFVLLTLTQIFFPLQGFWNFVFYIRPGVKKAMKSNPDMSLLGNIRDVIFKPETIVNVHRKSLALRRAKIPELHQSSRKEDVADSDTMSRSLHTNDQNSGESSGIIRLDDKSERGIHDLALAEIQACHQQDGKYRSSSTYTAASEGEEEKVEILDEEDPHRMNVATVKAIGNDIISNVAINHHVVDVRGNSMPQADLDVKIDRDYDNNSASSNIKTCEDSTLEKDLENPSQIRPQPKKVRRRVSLVNIGSILSDMEFLSLDGYSDSGES